MRRFLIFTGSIFIITVVLMVTLDWVYTYVYTNAAPRNKYQYILKLKPSEIDYVFLGSSRTANHIVTSDVRAMTGKSAINLGIEGAVLEDNLLELKLLLSRKVRIEKVFLQVDYLYENQGVSNIANSAALPFIRVPAIKSYLKMHMPHFNALYYIPFYRYMITDYVIGLREFLVTLAGKKSKVDLTDGYSPKIGSERIDTVSLPAQIAARNPTIEAFSAICADNHIKLIFFCAPFCSVTGHFDYVGKLKKKLPQLHDYSHAIDDRYFYNCGHLNVDGAKIFTKLLIEECCKNGQ